jgi:hypothetical protein
MFVQSRGPRMPVGLRALFAPGLMQAAQFGNVLTTWEHISDKAKCRYPVRLLCTLCRFVCKFRNSIKSVT